MNYGSYFRLNKNLSRIEDGFAVYDYIDLPAYFTASRANLMSPKYPICMMVTSDSVVFRLHYCAYKIEEDVNVNEKDSNYPLYLYGAGNHLDKGNHKVKPGDTTKIAHMEEVILELPFVDTEGRMLSDTIRSIYSTNFPQILSYQDNNAVSTEKSNSSGGRFLEKLIRKRYLEENVQTTPERDVNDDYYDSLRRLSDGAASYSTLWLMGLVTEEKWERRYRRTDKEGKIIGFLRKLLLDFMFDLKHSDLFQNSANYQKMYSGLMSDFYFSALMHKCEYYYYRKITSLAIKDVEDSYQTKKNAIKNENLTEAEREEKTLIIEKEKEERTKAIAVLYAYELVKAEDLWVKDIMNPQAEKNFEHQYPSKDPMRRYFREIIEYYSFEQWPSWFAEPEEEMRRVCFTMKDETGVRHICNADTLTKYLGFSRDNDDNTINKILNIRDDDREKISRWFLKRYAFSDVLHLHLFKHANLFFIIFLALPILFSWLSRESLLQIYTMMVYGGIMMLIAFLLFVMLYKYNVCKTCGCQAKCRLYKMFFYRNISSFGIVKARKDIILGKTIKVIFFILFFILFIYLGLLKDFNKFIKEHDWGSTIAIFVFLALVVAVIAILVKFPSVVSRLHLTLPRLVASITLAWITLSMGFDLYVSYFDSIPSIPYITVICVVVFLFVVYSINLVIPHSLPFRKLLRSLELMIISYFISLSVGFVIINFLGEKYLERGGYISDYYTQHVEKGNDSILKSVEYKRHFNNEKINTPTDTSCLGYGKVILQELNSIKNADNDTNSLHIKLVERLTDVHIENKDYKIAAKIHFWGMEIFVLRDFLIMFSFIAMFTGIFIQLIIFGDNKQMTEL